MKQKQGVSCTAGPQIQLSLHQGRIVSSTVLTSPNLAPNFLRIRVRGSSVLVNLDMRAHKYEAHGT